MLLLTPLDALLIFLEPETKFLIPDDILEPIEPANLIADLAALLKAETILEPIVRASLSVDRVMLLKADCATDTNFWSGVHL